MYARSNEELSDAIDAIDALDEEDKFVKRLHNNLERQEEWVALHRQELLTRCHNTNNYAEASIRIIKDIILNRTKAFNVTALVEFCSTVWEIYCKNRLLSFAHNQQAKPYIMYEALCKRMKDIDPGQAKQVITRQDNFSLNKFYS